MAGRFPKGVYTRSTRDWYTRNRHRLGVTFSASGGNFPAVSLVNNDNQSRNCHVTGLYVSQVEGDFCQGGPTLGTFTPAFTLTYPGPYAGEPIWVGDPVVDVFAIIGFDNYSGIDLNFFRFNFGETDFIYEPLCDIFVLPPMRSWEFINQQPSGQLDIIFEFLMLPD